MQQERAAMSSAATSHVHPFMSASELDTEDSSSSSGMESSSSGSEMHGSMHSHYLDSDLENGTTHSIDGHVSSMDEEDANSQFGGPYNSDGVYDPNGTYDEYGNMYAGYISDST